ncbi:DUF5085 family protein [Numidum massiliense]|uniref:DUF5085 family protein n=1 Tax=Numidum massiliense TaxID=1522315 RepID=UPI0006D59D8D|nr:DUF5085 family protein [Numidum massiliense]
MIVENHVIAHRNVASKLYRFVPEEIDLAMTDFDTILREHGYHTNGTLFFTIMSDPTAEIMTAELFLAIEEDDFDVDPEEEIQFHSYFFVDQMLMTRITADFNEQSQVQYWALIDYINKHDMSQRTPIFVVYKRSNAGEPYVEMSVGVGVEVA